MPTDVFPAHSSNNIAQKKEKGNNNKSPYKSSVEEKVLALSFFSTVERKMSAEFWMV